MNFPFGMQSFFSASLAEEFYNLFPELAFGDPNQFQTVPQVIAYIQQQLRSRHNYFSHAEQQYYIQRAQEHELEQLRHMVQPSFVEPVPQIRVRTTQRVEPPSLRTQAPEQTPSQPNTFQERIEQAFRAQTPASTTPVERTRRVNNFFQTRVPTTPNTLRELNEASSLMENIFGLSGFGLGRLLRRNDIITNLQPVIVHPSVAQIEAGSIARNASQEDVHENCSICLDAIAINSPVRVLRHCNHIFHTGCIDTWFERNVRCPNCNHDIRDYEQSQTPPLRPNPETILHPNPEVTLRPNPESSTSIDTISFSIQMRDTYDDESDDDDSQADSIS